MTTPPSDPPTTSPSQRRSSLPWMIAGAVAVVAAVVTFLLTTGGPDNPDGDDQRAGATDTPTSTAASTPPSSGDPGSTYDLGTPEAAAASFAAAAGTGSGETLLSLACVGRLACVAEHIPEATEEQLTEGRNQIREGVYELAQHLGGAEFGTAVDGAEPGTKDVPYRTPDMTGDASLALTFVQSEGEWLYYRPAA